MKSIKNIDILKKLIVIINSSRDPVAKKNARAWNYQEKRSPFCPHGRPGRPPRGKALGFPAGKNYYATNRIRPTLFSRLEGRRSLGVGGSPAVGENCGGNEHHRRRSARKISGDALPSHTLPKPTTLQPFPFSTQARLSPQRS